MRANLLFATMLLACAASGTAVDMPAYRPPQSPPRRTPPRPPTQLHALTPRQRMRLYRARLDKHAECLDDKQERSLQRIASAERIAERKRQREHERWLRTVEGRQATLKSNRERKAKRNRRRKARQG